MTHEIGLAQVRRTKDVALQIGGVIWVVTDGIRQVALSPLTFHVNDENRALQSEKVPQRPENMSYCE